MNAQFVKTRTVSAPARWRTIAASIAVIALLSVPTFGQSTLDELFSPQPASAEPSQPTTSPGVATEPTQPNLPTPPTPSRRGPPSRREAQLQVELESYRQQMQQLIEQRSRQDAQLKSLQAQIEEQQAGETPLPEDAQFRVFSVSHIPPKEAAAAILPILRGNKFRLSVVDGANVLIVASTEENLKKVADLLRGLETYHRVTAQPRTLQLRFFWFADELPDGVGTAPDVRIFSPAAYQAVADLGLKRPKLICQHMMSVANVPNELSRFSFRVPAILDGQMLQFTGEGTLRGEEQYRLDIETSATISIASQPGGAPYRTQQISNVSGSIATTEQHYVVMGTSNLVVPGGEPKSYPSAFVVYIGRAESISAEKPPAEGARGGRGRNSRAEENPFGK